jgi:predicted Zn finger-like uncharacterized protein
MSIRIVCPNCATAYNATDDQRGRRVRCKACQAIFCAAGPEPETPRNPDKEPNGISRPRKRKSFRKIPPLALFLIISGVGGSLLIVAGSVMFCIWLWLNPPTTWRAGRHVEALPRFPWRPRFPNQPPNFHPDQAADGDGKAVVAQGPEADFPLPPPPRELDFAAPRPVEQKQAQLVLRQQIGSRPFVLDSWLDFKVTGLDGLEHTGSASAETRLTATTEAVDAQESASVRLQYRAYNLKLRADNQDLPTSTAVACVRQNIKSLAANLRIDRQGNLVGSEVDLNRAPAAVRPVLANLHEEVEHSLENLAVPLPNREVAPGESWEAERTMLVPTLHRSVYAHLDMAYRYLGTRQCGGREDAVVDFKGVIRGLEDRDVKVTGQANGMAAVDLAAGQVAEAQMVLVFAVEMNRSARPLAFDGKLMLRLQCGSAGN